MPSLRLVFAWVPMALGLVPDSVHAAEPEPEPESRVDRGSEPPRELPVEIALAYYGHDLLHPGLATRVAYPALERPRGGLLVGGEVLGHWHIDNEFAFALRADLAGELRGKRGTAYRLHLGGGFRGGVLATPVYDASGQSASRGLLAQGQWGFGLEFAWPVRRSKVIEAISLQPELMLAHPSFYGADLDFGLRLGVLF